MSDFDFLDECQALVFRWKCNGGFRVDDYFDEFIPDVFEPFDHVSYVPSQLDT